VPPVLYLGQSVNLTLDIASNSSLGPLSLHVKSTLGPPHITLDENDFVPAIDASNKYGYYSFTPAVLGEYNVTFNQVDNSDGVSLPVPFDENYVFTVYPAVNQTLASIK
jgi:hypothetical protein